MDTIYSVYAIRSKVDKRLYIGMSQDVKRRLREHNQGQVFQLKVIDLGSSFLKKLSV